MEFLGINWAKIEKTVNKSLRRSEEAQSRANRILRFLSKSFAAKAHLYKQQEGICPYCKQAIIFGENWSVHHIFPKSQGGSDRLENLQLMHEDCHRKLHSDQPAACPVPQQLEPAMCR